MNRDEKFKKEKRNLRIFGVILMILGYGLAFAGMASESPFTILAMIIAFVGIIMILRSFLHQKYKGMNQDHKE